MKQSWRTVLCGIGCLLWSAHVWADKPVSDRLPEPLTLDAALGIAADQHPDVMLAHAAYLEAQALKAQVDSLDGFKASLEGGLARREYNGRDEDFNNAYLTLHKQLFDFNRSHLQQTAAETQANAAVALQQHALATYRHSVIKAFYDVLLADALYAVENEQMAIEYVRKDDAQEEYEVGALSELDMIALEEPYQRTLVRRNIAANEQRNRRALLAELLGYPGKLPETLVHPKQAELKKRPLAESKALQEKAMDNNPELKAAQLAVDAAEMRLEAADKINMPTVAAIGRAGWHSHVEEKYEGRWRADLAVSMPILDGGLKASQVDKAKAELMRQRATYNALERNIRQAVLETKLALDNLSTRVQQVDVAEDYAERYLDKSRTEYQFELKTDLGDSMVRLSRAEYEALELARDRALLWDQLDRLVGE